MTNSMTAFASRQGSFNSKSWSWEMRGVNARGLDIRLRVPDGIDGLETAIRGKIQERYKRGSVTLNLRLNQTEDGNDVAVDEAQLDRVLRALDQVQDRAMSIGVTLGQPTAADVLALKGVLVQDTVADDITELKATLLDDLTALLDDFSTMRENEGKALNSVLNGHIDEIEELTRKAVQAARARREEVKENTAKALNRVLEDVSSAEPDRVAQELALIAIKSDVTEELDRMTAHVEAARGLLADHGPVGRKLDFLSQEFNREANTLCSKAGSQALTKIGLDLKASIDQLREQIQNVE